MGWVIECSNIECNKKSWASNIVDLIDQHTDNKGWFHCSHCNKFGYIEKKFRTQEGDKWEPYLRGVIRLGTENEIYQPFVFIVSDHPTIEATDVWFSYYKDLRNVGGKLKLGYGPGGPPVLKINQLNQLLKHLTQLGLHKSE